MESGTTKPINGNEKEARMVRAFCGVHLPGINLQHEKLSFHLQRCKELFNAKCRAKGLPEKSLLEGLHFLDFYLNSSCIEGLSTAWETLFASKTGRHDQLLVDALRSRAARLFPGDTARQEDTVAEFWGFLLTGEKETSGSVLEKYDGRRPLIPWLIRVFHNSNLTKLRQSKHDKPLGDDEADEMYWHAPEISDEHWHQEFRLAAQEWLETLSNQEKLLLGLRVRYRLTQREAASFLGIHESNVSRLTDKIRQNFVQMIEPKLLNAGWSGEDMIAFVNTEMETLILDDPRLSSESLAILLAKKGLQAPLQNI